MTVVWVIVAGDKAEWISIWSANSRLNPKLLDKHKTAPGPRDCQSWNCSSLSNKTHSIMENHLLPMPRHGKSGPVCGGRMTADQDILMYTTRKIALIYSSCQPSTSSLSPSSFDRGDQETSYQTHGMIKVTFSRFFVLKRSRKLPDLISFSGFNFKTQKGKESEQEKETHVQLLFHLQTMGSPSGTGL